MSKTTTLFAILALGAAAALPAAAADMTLDQALANYDKARGGVEAWRKVQSLSMKGVYASWSQRHPFTLEQMRPGYYYFSSVSLRGPMVHAVDDKGPWWIMPAVGDPPFSKRPGPPHEALLTRAGLFEPPLLDAKAKGHGLKWLGAGDVDGQPTWDIELTLKGTEEKEIWHLDAATFLEVSIESTTYDFTQKGEPIPERAYFEDFRKVGGIVLPYKVQREFQARYTSLEVAEVVVDPPGLKPERFGYQLSPGMDWLRRLQGEHAVKFEFPGRPGRPWFSFDGTSKVESRYDGALLDETFAVPVFGNLQTSLRRWAFDRGDGVFRVMQTDDTGVSPSVFVGKIEEGKVKLDNQSTGSGAVDGGAETFERWTFEDLGAGGLRIEAESSSDEGKTWAPAWRATYTRPGAAAVAPAAEKTGG